MYTRKNVELLFELVLTIKPKNSKNKGQKEQLYQVTNGWGMIPLADMFQENGEHVQKVDLRGGSPANLVEIDAN